MVLDPQKIAVIARQIDILIQSIHEKDLAFSKDVNAVHPRNIRSAKNLVHYMALRAFDLRSLQAQLSEISLSSFAHAEGYILHNLYQLKRVLASLLSLEAGEIDWCRAPFTFVQSKQQLLHNTQVLFGIPDEDEHRTRIMVTMPGHAAEDYGLVKSFLIAGMNLARLNTSHDGPEVWYKIIRHIRKAEDETGKQCKIYIDLSGPKVRTNLERSKILDKSRVNKKEGGLRLYKTDKICLVKDIDELVKPKKYKKQLVGFIESTLPSLVDDVRVGHSIFFDDGKIGAMVVHKDALGAHVEILQAAEAGTKLKNEKGINLPDTHLNISALTAADLENLRFVAQYADIVGYSFVRAPQDVLDLQEALTALGRSDMHIVLKIENKAAFDNLPKLILAAMRFPMAGVMIARGDLAVEIGFQRTAEVQEEIMWICEAAHLPDIWATQVLEQLAKKGLATRSEITDAAMAARAECVMLNKGPYIVQAIQTLRDILSRMEMHMNRKQGSFRPLSVASHFFDKSASVNKSV